MICDVIVENLSVQQIMSYSKSSLSHYHTSAKKRPISLVIAHTKDLLSLLYFPDAHVCNRSTSKEKKNNNIPNERIQNIYICFAIFLVIVYAVRLVLSCFRAHRIASNHFSMHQIFRMHFQLFATYVLYLDGLYVFALLFHSTWAGAKEHYNNNNNSITKITIYLFLHFHL